MNRVSITSREIRFASRPEGTPTADTFAMAVTEVPPPTAGQVQVRNLWMSVDPYMRGRMMTRESYVPGFRLGEALEGGAIGRVEASMCEDFAPGDLVQSMLGWREAFNAPPAALTKVKPTSLPPEALLGAAGLPGLTAFVGVDRVVELQAGEVICGSAASGAVGSVACQIAKVVGATVIGSAGGAENAPSCARSASTTSSTTGRRPIWQPPWPRRRRRASTPISTMSAAPISMPRCNRPRRSHASRCAA